MNIQSCLVGLDYLGIDHRELDIDWNGAPVCSYYNQVEDDIEHPTERKRCCGNCTHYIILEVSNEEVPEV